MSEITGECFCSSVGHEISGKLVDARFCHCSQCRKVSNVQVHGVTRLRGNI